MNKLSTLWLFSDTPARLAELMGGARQLAESVVVFTLNPSHSTLAFQLGASQVWQLEGKPDECIIEDYASLMADSIKQQADGGLVLLPNTRRGKLLAARLSYRLNAVVANDAVTVNLQDKQAAIKHLVYGGLALGEETLLSPFSIVTVSSGTFEPATPDSSASGSAQPLHWLERPTKITRQSVKPRQSSAVNLDKARLVVGIGRGIGSKENIALAADLAKAIGAELACSRPVAENEKWLEHERYIGISNLMIKPDLYLAIGISGQIQHMVGVNNAQTIIAINKDKNAPIFQYADYGVVGDLFKILPALTSQLKN